MEGYCVNKKTHKSIVFAVCVKPEELSESRSRAPVSSEPFRIQEQDAATEDAAVEQTRLQPSQNGAVCLQRCTLQSLCRETEERVKIKYSLNRTQL